MAKTVEPKLSLGTCALAAMLPDVLWPIFSMSGLEYTPGMQARVGNDRFVAPISHSLLMVLVWGVIFAAAYFLWRRYRRGAVILFFLVLSHWFFDAIAHKLPLTPSTEAFYGLELWNSLPATLFVEGGFWLVALVLYVRSTHPEKWSGVFAFWPIVVFLTFVWVTNIRSGPPPPNAGVGSLVFFLLLVVWAYWMNRSRTAYEYES
jgi:hypothetical protein